jgi:hypothetical protein
MWNCQRVYTIAVLANHTQYNKLTVVQYVWDMANATYMILPVTQCKVKTYFYYSSCVGVFVGQHSGLMGERFQIHIL